jgi:hypothetical protein
VFVITNCVSLIVFALFWIACHRPPVVVTTGPFGAHIDVQTLGEYQTTIAVVCLIDADTGTVLWDLRSDRGGAQLATLDLKPGENSAILYPRRVGKLSRCDASTNEDVYAPTRKAVHD